jgi:hypothetical protein
MSTEEGPIRLSRERLAAARTPPIQKRSVPAEVLRKYRSTEPLRRPAAAPQYPAPEPLPVTGPEVEQAMAVAEQGKTIDVRAEGGDLTVRVVPAVLEAVRQSGLNLEEMKRFLDRLARALGRKERVAQLRQLAAQPDGMPELRVYRTVLGRPGVAHVLRFVFAVLPELSAVLVVSCFARRQRTD